MSADVEISKGIVTNPGRRGGEPTVKGTRIDAHLIASLLSDGSDPYWILDGYPSLTYADLVNVKGWVKRLG